MSDILAHRDGHLGHLVLNRPKALNALTHSMGTELHRYLKDWEHDDSVTVVLISGAGERGLCAGGDIVSIYEDARSGGTGSAEFWADEYRLNLAIANYPKPYVAFMDGIVLGGGVGISAHGQIRVVTERSKIGMPETGIGFFPDVGGTHLLSRAPGELGTHLALTAGSVDGADAIAIGMADVFVPSDQLETLREALVAADSPEAVAEAVARVAIEPPPSSLLAQQEWVDVCYQGDDLATILERLAARTEPEAADALRRITRNSPTACAVTLRAMRSAGQLGDLAATLDQDYRLAVRFLDSHDLPEGIRAQVIDKDRSPQWDPADIAAVTSEQVDAFFAPLEHELGLATAGTDTTPDRSTR